jgi:glycerophosphoryl diester phosphodiesterase
MHEPHRLAADEARSMQRGYRPAIYIEAADDPMKPSRAPAGRARWHLALFVSAAFLCCADQESAASAAQLGYWAAISRALPMAPSGNVVGISCHNCYRSRPGAASTNLSETLERIAKAQAADADILELDVKEQSGQWYVDHDDEGSRDGPLLADVLGAPTLRAGDQLLYIEIKETRPTRHRIARLLGEITRHGYPAPGRDVILRSFNSRFENLRLAKKLLASPEFAPHAPHFRLQVLYQKREVDDDATASRLMRSAMDAGMDGVEFHYRCRHIWQLLNEARALGLGTNIWTFRSRTGTSECARFRDSADSLTTDSSPQACRRAVLSPSDD